MLKIKHQVETCNEMIFKSNINAFWMNLLRAIFLLKNQP